MLRNPAYAGTAVFGKTQVLQQQPGLNRRARLEGRSTPRASKTVDLPREDWIEIPVPAIVRTETFERAARRLADNKRYASRNTKVRPCSGLPRVLPADMLLPTSTRIRTTRSTTTGA